MRFEHCVRVFDSDNRFIGVLESQDESGGKPIAWCFVSEGNTLSQEELEAIAAKLRELNEAARPGVNGE